MTLKPTSSQGSGGGGGGGPGYEIGYDQITSAVNIASTTEASGTTIISCAAHTFDGSPVICEFFTPRIISPAETVAATPVTTTVCLFESSTEIAQLAIVVFGANTTTQNALQVPVRSAYRFTPTAASHTYTITAFASSTNGPPSVQAGAGGTSTQPPAFVRFTKV